MEGLRSVQARIASIEQQVGLAPTVEPLRSRAHGATSGTASFETVLASALEASAPTAASTATARSGSAPVPAELAAYGNGQVPASAMTSIGIGNHRLSNDAAAAFRSMHAAAARDGVTIGVTDSYRSLDAQVDLARRKGLYSQGGLAAEPGTSNHGWGLSVDVDVDARGQEWLRANGARFGFVEDTPREPWHWTYRPAAV